MASVNKVILLGNLTRDPELRVTPKGTAICQFSLAVNRQYKDESGNLRDEVSYIDVEAWGRQGETISQYCRKGRPLFVEGRLRLDQWEDKTSGQKRNRLKVVLESFQFINGGRDSNANAGSDEAYSQAPYERQSPPPRQPRASVPPPEDNIDEDVPF